MMTLKCKDMGLDCRFEAHGNSKEDVKRAMMGHVRDAHPELISDSDDEMEDLDAKMDSMISEAG